MNSLKMIYSTHNIKNRIGEPACLEQLAEEAAELAQAALKLARIKRGENPTPVDESDAMDNLFEELSDVFLAAYTFGIVPDIDIMSTKRMRWLKRTFEDAADDDE